MHQRAGDIAVGQGDPRACQAAPGAGDAEHHLRPAQGREFGGGPTTKADLLGALNLKERCSGEGQGTDHEHLDVPGPIERGNGGFAHGWRRLPEAPIRSHDRESDDIPDDNEEKRHTEHDATLLLSLGKVDDSQDATDT